MLQFSDSGSKDYCYLCYCTIAMVKTILERGVKGTEGGQQASGQKKVLITKFWHRET